MVVFVSAISYCLILGDLVACLVLVIAGNGGVSAEDWFSLFIPT